VLIKNTVKNKFPILLMIYTRQLSRHMEGIMNTLLCHLAHKCTSHIPRTDECSFPAFLHKFLLVFFYDIFIYKSVNIKDHVIHLRQVFHTLRSNSFFYKRSKCFFTIDKVEYLGHFISKEGVFTDPRKIESMAN